MKDSSKVILTLSLSLLIVPFDMVAGGGRKKMGAWRNPLSISTIDGSTLAEQEAAVQAGQESDDTPDDAAAPADGQQAVASIPAEEQTPTDANNNAEAAEAVAPQAPSKKAFQIFARAKAEYAPPAAYVPEQAMIRVRPFAGGYAAVIQEVKNLDSELTAAQQEDTRRYVGNAARDIIGYLDNAIKSGDLKAARDYIIALQELALAADQKGVMPEDRKDNVVAWINTYVDKVEELEQKRTQEIASLYSNDTEQRFSWSELATQLGLKVDPSNAVNEFVALTKEDVATDPTEYKASATRLVQYLTEQGRAEKSKEALKALSLAQQVIAKSSDLGIVVDSQALIEHHAQTEEQKNKALRKTKNILKEGLKLAAEFNALARATRTAAADHYAADIVAKLGTEDTMDYASNDGVRALFSSSNN